MSTLATMEFAWDDILPQDAATTPFDIWIIDLVFEYQEIMREFVLEYLHRNVFLELPPYSIESTHMELLAVIRAIETNLRNLVGTDVTATMEFAKIWHGGTRDFAFFDFRDVNRWFRTIELLHRLLQSLQPQHLVTNFFRLGQEAVLQVIGVTEPWTGV